MRSFVLGFACCAALAAALYFLALHERGTPGVVTDRPGEIAAAPPVSPELEARFDAIGAAIEELRHAINDRQASPMPLTAEASPSSQPAAELEGDFLQRHSDEIGRLAVEAVAKHDFEKGEAAEARRVAQVTARQFDLDVTPLEQLLVEQRRETFELTRSYCVGDMWPHPESQERKRLEEGLARLREEHDLVLTSRYGAEAAREIRNWRGPYK